MTKKIKDTDYLAVSARIRAMENRLLTQEQFEQLLQARSGEEAAKLLQSFGYPELDPARPEEMDAALSAARAASIADLAPDVPDAGLVDVFKLKYDYHNLKTLLKAAALETDASHMLADLGRVGADALREALATGETGSLPGFLARAAEEARTVLETTRDPQLSDAVLDRWYYADLLSAAEGTGSAFLTGWVRLQIDAANLRTLVRTIRMGKNADFLRGVLFPGGTVEADGILAVSAADGAGLAELYAATDLRDAAASGAETLRGGYLTEFERLCDDTVNAYLDRARLIPFGEAPLLAYLAWRETEYMDLRIALLGRAAGLPADVIRARLRAGYR